MRYYITILLLTLCLADAGAQGLRRGGVVVRTAATRRNSCVLPGVYVFSKVSSNYRLSGSERSTTYDLYVNGALNVSGLATGSGGQVTLPSLSSKHGTLTIRGRNSCGTVVMSGSVVQ